MNKAYPFFSVVVPTYARPHQLAACLQRLAQLQYPRDRFEVVVVDDGSPTPPAQLIAAFHDQIDVRLHVQQRAGPATARNTGAERARGDFLAFTDDDCAPAADWLQALEGRIVPQPDALVGGRTINALTRNLYSTASQLLVGYLYAYYFAAGEGIRFFTSNNIALSRERFHAIGGFDTTYPHAAAEDREFCDRWLYHGNRMVYAPEVMVYHAHALTLPTFWRQHMRYGRGAYRFHRGRAGRDEARIEIEPLRFYLNLLRYPFLHERGARAWVLAALMGVSQAANAAGYFWERGVGKSAT